MSGMVSVRNGGKSIAELSGIYLGNAAKYIMRVVSMILLILSGAVLVTSPVSLLAELTPNVLDSTFWTVVILVYYVLATLLPIDKVIGRLYPIFGVIIILMAVGIIGGILFSDSYMMPELQLENLNPNGLSV